MFNGGLYYIYDDLDGLKIPVNHIPKGMSMPSKFYDIPYC